MLLSLSLPILSLALTLLNNGAPSSAFVVTLRISRLQPKHNPSTSICITKFGTTVANLSLNLTFGAFVFG